MYFWFLHVMLINGFIILRSVTYTATCNPLGPSADNKVVSSAKQKYRLI